MHALNPIRLLVGETVNVMKCIKALNLWSENMSLKLHKSVWNTNGRCTFISYPFTYLYDTERCIWLAFLDNCFAELTWCVLTSWPKSIDLICSQFVLENNNKSFCAKTTTNYGCLMVYVYGIVCNLAIFVMLGSVRFRHCTKNAGHVCVDSFWPTLPTTTF